MPTFPADWNTAWDETVNWSALDFVQAFEEATWERALATTGVTAFSTPDGPGDTFTSHFSVGSYCQSGDIFSQAFGYMQLVTEGAVPYYINPTWNPATAVVPPVDPVLNPFDTAPFYVWADLCTSLGYTEGDWRRHRPRMVNDLTATQDIPTGTDALGNPIQNNLTTGNIAWFIPTVPDNGLCTRPGKLIKYNGGPITDPGSAPTLVGSSTGGGLSAGDYSVTYTYSTLVGETLPSPEATVTVTDQAATGSLTFNGLVSDGSFITIDGFTFAFSVVGSGAGSSVTLTETAAGISVTFTQHTAGDVCSNLYSQLSNSTYTPYFTATNTGNTINLTQVTPGSGGNGMMAAQCAGIVLANFSGGTTSECSITVTGDALPGNAVLMMVYVGGISNDTSDTNSLEILSMNRTSVVQPTLNQSAWGLAGTTDLPDMLKSENDIAAGYYCAPGSLSNGDYIGPHVFNQLRDVLNKLTMTCRDTNDGDFKLFMYGQRRNYSSASDGSTPSVLAVAKANCSAAWIQSTDVDPDQWPASFRTCSGNHFGPSSIQIFGASEEKFASIFKAAINNHRERTISWWLGAVPFFDFDQQGNTEITNGFMSHIFTTGPDATSKYPTTAQYPPNVGTEPPNWPVDPNWPTVPVTQCGWGSGWAGIVVDWKVTGGFRFNAA